MQEPRSGEVVALDEDGTLRVVSARSGQRIRTVAGKFVLAVEAPGLVILRDDAPSAPRVLMAGEVISRTTVLEILNVIASSGWRGEMHVLTQGARRVLAIDAGVLRHARSDHPDDRLGQVLFRNGVLSRDTLDDLLADFDPDRRLGQLLLDKGILSQDALFKQLQKQIEQVFFACLLAGSGYYAFVRTDAEEAPAHSVHLPVAALLMEGVQQIDEMALFRERIPSDDAVVFAQTRASLGDLDTTARNVLLLADGTRTVDGIARETGLGLFHTVKTIYGLLQRNAVLLEAPRGYDATVVRRLVGEFNAILRDLFMAVAAYGGVEQTRSTLEAWIVGSGYASLFGEHVGEDGSLDLERVVDAMRSLRTANPMDGLLLALHELAAFALFAATTTLPREQELALSKDVSQRLKRVKL